MSADNEAKRLLGHYLRTLAKRAGMPWDSDNDAEVDMIVDSIIDAAAIHVHTGKVRFRRPTVDRFNIGDRNP